MRKNYCSRLVGLLFLLLISISLNAQNQKIDYSKADSVGQLYPNHPLNDLRNLTIKLTKPFSTEHEKFRVIYRWICENIENDYNYYLMNKRKRAKFKGDEAALGEWNREFAPKVIERLVKQQKTVCTGYAYLLKEMTLYVDIECELVNGYGKNLEANNGGDGIPNHSWNAVKLDGEWYLCDPTWSSGSINLTHKAFEKTFNSGYFLASPKLFAMSHYPLDTKWLLMDNAPTLEYFLNGPLVYKGAFNTHLTPIYPNTFNLAVQRGEEIEFCFLKEGNIEEDSFQLEIVKGSSARTVIPEISQSSGRYYFKHTFNSKGLYVLHLKTNDQYIVTYRIKVSK
ncbi:transglutaminase domain-containing protein [Chondrinema litorale]|uniref:transglutaminase domain-containing protein n=1 Tax=Chondrinema litorale TaxID=2994555 RepID=UPI0025431B61|nr:transglutaminase domain-containing protein [Chondrinema litorale]UZR96603.1 hypothetical protein OQ292_20865 [Chondrinema litorale]